MIRPIFFAGLFVSMLACVGCESSTTYSFDVVVTNKLSVPVSVWLTTNRPPYKEGWEPPELIAQGTTGTTHMGGVIVKPGDTAEARVKNDLNKDQYAILRVYKAVDLNAMLAMDFDNPDRGNCDLDSGRSDLDVIIQDGKVTVVPHNSEGAAP